MPPDTAREGALVIGTITIAVGTNHAGSIKFDTRSSQVGNWLDQEGLKGYIITWSKDNPLQALKNWRGDKPAIKLQVDLDERSSSSGSLWLFYLN